MTSDEKEVDEKLYRVVRKKGSHVNTKVNSVFMALNNN